MAGWRGAEPDQSAGAVEPPWTTATNPALTSLLDHLAEELAREYVRLMELAANPVEVRHDNEEH